MRVPGELQRICWTLAVALVCGCHHAESAAPASSSTPRAPTFTASRLRSFSDSYAITAIADSPTALFAGTPHGLIRWEAGRWSVMTQKDGLPADRVAAVAVDGNGTLWIATAKGLSRGLHGAWTNFAAAPVGSFLTGLLPGSDGKIIWAGGPEGLARLRGGKWERYFSDTGVTALVAGLGGLLWVGTSGTGVLRITRDGGKIEKFGANQGCEIDVVRGMVAVNKTLLVVGEGPGGARAAFYDGERFYSYALSSPSVIEWAARAGAATLLGAGDHVYELATQPGTVGEETPRAAAVKLTPIPSWIVAPRAIGLKADAPSAALDDPPNTPKPQPALAAVNAKSGAVSPPMGPQLAVADSSWSLPEGVTAVAGSERGLLVGTRFVGAVRVENGVPRRFQLQDLAASAVRLTVACAKSNDECYLATGTTRAWRFDGQAFEVAPIDPEPGARVLAVLLDPQGDVLAIHRGAEDRQLRLSRVSDGHWTPVGIQAVEVPEGAPDLNFAEFAPDGHLWVGLRYTDREKDARDYGADEIALDNGKVLRHEEVPTDVVAMFWKAKNEAWFATRSGAARLLDGKVRVFTENDGMESDITRDIGPGPGGAVLVATGRGTGRFDGTRWTFPRLGPFYPASNSLAHDGNGNAFVGTVRGLYCIGDCLGDPIDKKRGLSDDDVRDVVVDRKNRVWVLTEKGINVVEP